MDLLSLFKQYGVTDEQSLLAILNELPVEQKIQLLQILESKGQYTYKDYDPQEYQREFHLSPAFIRALIAANRTGKTFGCMHDLIWFLTGDYPDWFPPALKRETPFHARWIATDFKHGIGDVFQPTFKRIVPGPYKDGPIVKKIIRTQQGYYQKIMFQNGSELGLMTDQQDLEEFEGWAGHRLDIDEPCGYQKYLASARGLIDYNGRVCMHLTPLAEPWIYDEIFTKADGKEIYVKQVSIYDNKYNTKQAIERFEKQCAADPDMAEARLKGHFKHLKGLIYKLLDRDVHTIKDYSIPPHYPIVMVMDPHDRKPHNIIWAAINEYGHRIVIKNATFSGTVLETSRFIKKTERENGWVTNLRIGDPNKFKAPAAVGQTGSLQSAFAKYGLTFYTNVNDKIDAGHHAVRQCLFWDKSKPRRLGNQPSLYWFREGGADCFNEMLRYTYYEEKNPDNRGLKEKPKEAHKDYPDTIRYLVMANPTYEPVNQVVETEEPIKNDNPLDCWE